MVTRKPISEKKGIRKMKTTWIKFNALALLFLVAACGGGGGSGGGATSGGGGGTSATGVDWTWVGGIDTGMQPSIFSASGVASSGVPGASEGASSWTDTSGNLWLFGGSKESVSIDVNNLWKFDGTNWLWMNGSQGVDNPLSNFITLGAPNAKNDSGPGARQYAVTWISHDSANNIDYLWLFGGYVRNALGTADHANDLWKYNTSSGEWTWVSGSNAPYQKGNYGAKALPTAGSVPGARYGAAFWKDASGNFWLFGGSGCDTNMNGNPCTQSRSDYGALNDFWKYNPTSNQWTWMSGSDTKDQPGIYGTKGTSNGSNIPGGRYLGVSWIDNAGDLWLFGGRGNDAAGMLGDLNDLWKYNITNNQWTWISGDNKIGQFGSFGTAGIPAATNVPGARRTAIAWTDNLGNFWLFGGAEDNPASATGTDNLNDLWKFNVTDKWVWMSGSNAPNKFGTYGSQGISAPANVPGARDTSVSWTSKDGKTCWLLGGTGYDGSGTANYSTVPMNDFWKFVPK
jgi:hypothetical protein